MKLVTAMILGAVVALVLPQMFGGQDGVWMNSWSKWGTIRPHAGSPGLLFSVPVFVGATLMFRAFFNWHTG